MSEGELCVFEAGTILFHEGDQEVEKAYVILSGGVDVTIDGESVASLSV
ncbi:MAG TPA: hypothetical protein PK765_03015 [bacterium]|nr:hypothetical protein [bacterium]